jgi:hypothetical protein
MGDVASVRWDINARFFTPPLQSRYTLAWVRTCE